MFMIILLKLHFTEFVNLLNRVVRLHDYTLTVCFLDYDRVVLHYLNNVSPLPEVFFDILVQEFVAFKVEGGFDSLFVVNMFEFGFFGVSDDRAIGV